MGKDTVLDAVVKRCHKKDEKKYITCSEVFQISKELDISVSVIGEKCNKSGIKIKGCQIGCF